MRSTQYADKAPGILTLRILGQLPQPSRAVVETALVVAELGEMSQCVLLRITSRASGRSMASGTREGYSGGWRHGRLSPSETRLSAARSRQPEAFDSSASPSWPVSGAVCIRQA